MAMIIRSLCVFCGSSFGTETVYGEKTREFGKYLAERKITLIYGGGAAGLMGVLAEAVLDNGGSVIGIIPEMIYKKVEHLPLTETIITEDMHSRKRMMYDKSDAFTALPGGIGTIEEISEIYTWQQLGYHRKAVSLYNINNFYYKFAEFLDSACDMGFIKEIHRNRLIIEQDAEKLIEKIENYSEETVDKWS